MTGTTPVASMIFCNSSMLKLETPIALTFLVSLLIRTISFQVAATPGASQSMTRWSFSVGISSLPARNATGQWISQTSR